MTAATATAPAPAGTAVRTAVLVAGASALLPWRETTVVARLAAQLADLGVTDLHVVTRPQWATQLRTALPDAEVHACPDAAADLRLITRLARESDGGLF